MVGRSQHIADDLAIIRLVFDRLRASDRVHRYQARIIPSRMSAELSYEQDVFLSSIKVPSLTISGSAPRARVASSHGKNTLSCTERLVTSMLPVVACPSTLARN